MNSLFLAFSMPSSRLFLFFFSFFAATFAGTVNLDWKIGWINANPDGQALRPVISINGQWPNPTIYANLGDQVSIHVTNNLGNETTSLHFHGLYQTGTNDMDGGSGVSQCPIPPNSSFTYTFQVSPNIFYSPIVGLLTSPRSTNLGLIGTTATPVHNTRTASVDL
jgi:FtsP/CotA-like multicopper oxidase with cupredoxin domain